MNVQEWVRRSAENIRSDGIKGVRASGRPVYRKLIEQGCRFTPAGTNVYDRDWDLLIVLDACRLDLMLEVADQYEFIPAVDSFRSVDSTTALWMDRTFVSQHRQSIADTVYICGNPFSADQLDENDFERLDEVWQTSWTDIGTVSPRAITDRTIAAFREGNPERVIAHYMQPHCPFVPAPELMASKNRDEWGNQDTRDVWEQLRDGDLTLDAVWDGYRANLEHVLADVELLLNSVDADDVVITSDHGNATGEWRIYGHPPRMPFDALREVPWIETTATDDGTYDVGELESDSTDVSVTDQLEALGYAD